MTPAAFTMTRRRMDVMSVLAGGGAFTGWELMRKTRRSGPAVYEVLDVLCDAGWVLCEWLPEQTAGNPRQRVYWIPDALIPAAKMLLVEHVRLV